MLKRYIIDSSFEFCPVTCQLTVFGAEDFVITLHVPVSRCLELLLERRFDLVSQHDFYQYVWQDDAKNVSVDTLYQSISLLRNALKSISKEYKVMILTIPRKGFKFNQIFSVQEQIGEEIIESSSNNDMLIENLTKALGHEDNVNDYPTNPLQHKKSVNLKSPYFYIMVTLALIVTLWVTYLAFKNKELSPLSYYTHYSEPSGCIIYTNPANYDLPGKIKSIRELGADCKVTPYIYITAFSYSTRVSAISCDSPIESEASSDCTTYNLIGDSNVPPSRP
ncbi:winged helix-turn-helix domain-containing protein [Serratia fonticola]|uniref:Winged helix-turn-helix domain-containing protein n=1 Tax=Serratia fonticola TaxID=47917 RepID=A0AAE7JU75_SERFO|nr:winged helix-turn-helix domain-containing protein [Serratia fonticola]QKJ59632.1 winged helix-turn-helix domain-containing protein [Serratia fonticola]